MANLCSIPRQTRGVGDKSSDKRVDESTALFRQKIYTSVRKSSQLMFKIKI